MPEKPEERLTSQRAYARHRGCTLRAVQCAIDSDRLCESVVYVDGIAKIRDVAVADLEWAANTDLSRAPDAVKVREARRHETTCPFELVARPWDAERVLVGFIPPGPDDAPFDEDEDGGDLVVLDRADAMRFAEMILDAVRRPTGAA